MRLRLFLFAYALFSISVAAQVEDLKFREPDIKDLMDVLDVRLHAGSFRLRSSYSEIRIVVEGYRKNELIFSASSGGVLAKNKEINYKGGVVEFRVMSVDLDVVHLRQGPPKTCRIFVGFSAKDGPGSSAPTDVAKEKFDLSAAFNSWPTLHSGPLPKDNVRPADKDGRTLLFQLHGGDYFDTTDPSSDGSATFHKGDLLLKCYFVGK